MSTTTGAGSTIAICATLPSVETEAGYSALTFTEIGQVEKIGSMGAVYAKTEFQPLFGPKQKHKGAADYGSLAPSLAHDESDPGQAILRAAADSPNQFAFRVVYPTGAKRFFQGKVFGYPETVDGADALLMVTPTIEINSVIVKVAATGAIVLPSVSLSGALSKSEGDSGTVAYTYIVTLSQAAPVGGTAVPWALAYGSTDASDFASGQATSGTLTIAQGQLSGTVTINAKGDTNLEGDETFTFLISTPPGYIAGAATSATGTILNDDAPPAPVFTSQPSISPTSGTAGTTVFAANDGVATNATSITRRWLLGTTVIGTGATVVAPTEGTLTLENTAAGPGGSKTVTSTAVTVAAAASSVNLAMTQLADGRIYQRSTTTGSANGKGAGSVQVPIALDGAANSVEYRLRDAVANGNPVLQDWTTAASNVAANATSVTCPNVPARLGWYYLDLRANGGAAQLGTSKIGIGRIVAISGQSQAVRQLAKMPAYAGTNASLGVTISANTAVYARYTDSSRSLSTPAWAAPADGSNYDSTFAAEFLRRQADSFGVNCALTGHAVGSTAIATWQPGQANNVDLRAVLDAAGGFEAFYWHQGGDDASAGTSAATYQSALSAVFGDLAAHNSARGSSFERYVTAMATRLSGGAGTVAQVQTIRKAASDWAGANSATYLEPHDINLEDNVHQGQSGSIVLARHLHRATTPATDNRPTITSGTRSGTAITLTASAAVAMTGDASPRFSVYAAGTSTSALAIATVSVSGTAITVNLSADPGSGQALDVHWLRHPDPSGTTAAANIIYDTYVADGLPNGRQLRPTLSGPVSIAAPNGGTTPTTFSDTFTSAIPTAASSHVSDSGHTWAKATTDDLTVSGGVLYKAASGSVSTLSSFTQSSISQYAEADAVYRDLTRAATTAMFLLLRVQGTSTWLQGGIQETSTGVYVFTIGKTIAGTFTSILTAPFAPTANAVNRLRAEYIEATSTLRLLCDGAEVVSATVTDAAITTAGRIGARITGFASTTTSGNYFDNMTAGAL